MTDETIPEPALLRWAAALTKDATAAEALVAHTLQADSEQTREGQSDHESRVSLFRSMRQSYHSIERAKPPTRKRGPALTPAGGAVAADDDEAE